MKKLLKYFLIIALSFLSFSCAYHPILDQNAKYREAGEVKAQDDIKQCETDAKTYLKQYKAARYAKEAGRKAIIGTVLGTILGVITGRNLSRIITSAAIGAGVGASVGALGVAGEGNVTPDQIKQNYVNNCLARKGYSVIGWQ